MAKFTMIEMQGCPYCANARKAIAELQGENVAYDAVEIEYIDENLQPELTKPYAGQYYYVPSIFAYGTKIYEAQPGQTYEEIREHVREGFEAAIG